MKTLAFVPGLLLVALPAFAMKPCEELKGEIAAQLDGKGVVGYTLDIVPNDQVGTQTVVGSCDGGTKKITYERGAKPDAAAPMVKGDAPTPAPATPAPAAPAARSDAK
jgi:hypothetical protein